MKRFQVAVVLVALFVAACGGTSANPSSSSSSGGPNKVASIAAEVPDSVKSKAPIQIATDATYEPDEYIDANTGDIVGWDIDFGKAVCRVMGVACTFNNVIFSNIIPQLTASEPRYLLSFSSFTPTEEREKSGIDFVSYYKAGEGWVVKADSKLTINSAADMCGHTVAVETGTTEETDAWAFMGKEVGGTATAGAKDNCAAAGKGPIKVSSFEKQTDANTALLSGRADIGFLDSQIAAYQVKQTAAKLKTAGQGCSVAPYGIAMAKGSPLQKAVVDAVKYLIDNGYYAQILKKWSVEDGAIKSSDVKVNDNNSIGPSCIPS